jgi:hypothetical protein
MVDQDGALGLSLSVTAGFAAELRAGFDRMRADEERRRLEECALIPFDFPIRGGGIGPASGSLVFELGGPPLGRSWVVRRLVVALTDPTTPDSASAFLFASSTGDADQLTTATCFDFASALPAVWRYSSRQVVVAAGQHIWCKIVSPTSGANYSASGTVLSEVEHEPAAARYSL